MYEDVLFVQAILSPIKAKLALCYQAYKPSVAGEVTQPCEHTAL